MKGRIKSKSKPAAGQTCSLMCNGISSGERNESISPFHKELTRGGGKDSRRDRPGSDPLWMRAHRAWR